MKFERHPNLIPYVLEAQFAHTESTLMEQITSEDEASVSKDVLKKLLIKVKECGALLNSAMYESVEHNQF